MWRVARFGARAAVLVIVSLMGACASTSATTTSTWISISPPVDGFALAVTAVDPVAGTPIFRGQPVTFTVTMNYALDSAPRGTIALVIQDEEGRSLAPRDAQVKHAIEKGGGTITLTDTVTIKHRAHRVVLFVVLFPEGVKSVDPAVIIRWPAIKAKKA